jgi:hypothetical protein
MLIFGSFTHGRLFDFIFAHFWFNGVLYFSLKNLFVEIKKKKLLLKIVRVLKI